MWVYDISFTAWKCSEFMENRLKVTNSNPYIKLPSFRKLVGEEKMQGNSYSFQELKDCRALTFEWNKINWVAREKQTILWLSDIVMHQLLSCGQRSVTCCIIKCDWPVLKLQKQCRSTDTCTWLYVYSSVQGRCSLWQLATVVTFVWVLQPDPSSCEPWQWVLLWWYGV